jgi:hypothetical protein
VELGGRAVHAVRPALVPLPEAVRPGDRVLDAPQIALSLLWRGEPISMQDVTTNADLKLLVGGVTLSTVILAGGTANFLLFRRAQAAIRLVQSRGASEEQAQSLLARVGRVNAIAVLGGLALMLVSFGLYQGGVR